MTDAERSAKIEEAARALLANIDADSDIDARTSFWDMTDNLRAALALVPAEARPVVPMPLRYCNKCGYVGQLQNHDGCPYHAYEIAPDALDAPRSLPEAQESCAGIGEDGVCGVHPPGTQGCVNAPTLPAEVDRAREILDAKDKGWNEGVEAAAKAIEDRIGIGPAAILAKQIRSLLIPTVPPTKEGTMTATPDHIQVVTATLEQIDAFNRSQGAEWVIYFTDPVTGACAQTFARLESYPRVRCAECGTGRAPRGGTK